MNLIKLLFTSSLGKKYLMAFSGACLFGFVIVHMLGNLQIFLGPDTLNAYGAFLKSMTGLLWSFRLGLLALVGLHIYCAISLSLENRAARPVTYENAVPFRASYASRTMVWSGVIVFSFIIYHLLHFTVGAVNSEYLAYRDELGRHDVYRMVVAGFSSIWVSGFYILSMGLLCIHLAHGVSSMVHSIGLRTKNIERFLDWAAIGIAAAIFLGNSSIPLAVLLGIVK